MWLDLDIDRQSLSGPGTRVLQHSCGMIKGSRESNIKVPKLHAGDEGNVYFKDRSDARCMICQTKMKIWGTSTATETSYELVTADGQVVWFEDDHI